MVDLYQKSKEAFLDRVKKFGQDPYALLHHVPEMEKWARFMLNKHPSLDKDVVLSSVWLHDIGHYPIPTDIDHAVRSEEISRELLKSWNYDKEKITQILHCIRAHRCKDVIPESDEAKVIAVIDSASHMSDMVYLKMMKEGEFSALEKIERDFRDISRFSEFNLQNDLQEIYEAWRVLLKRYEKVHKLIN